MKDEAEQPSLRYAWYVIGVLFLAYTFSYIDRQILALLVKPVRADLGLSDTQFSLLVGLAFGIFYTLMGLPLGRMADNGNRRNLMAAGIAIWSLMTALCGLTRNFWQLFLARIGVGVGEAALSPAAYSLIADYFPANKLGRALATYSTGVYAGAGLAYIVGGLVISALTNTPQLDLPIVGVTRSWQVVFFIVGLPGLLIALLMFSVREPLRKNMGGITQTTVGLKQLATFVIERRGIFVAHFVGFALLAFIFNAVAVWMPAHFMRNFDYDAGQFGIHFGLIIAIFGSAGIVCGGWFGDWLAAKGYKDAPMRAATLGATSLIPFVIIAPLLDNVTIALMLLCPLIFFSAFPYGVAAAALQLVTPNRMRGQISALYLFVVNLAGVATAPTITALVTDYVFQDDLKVGYSIALVTGIAAPLSAIVLWRTWKPFREGYTKMAEAN
jgi:MFS family permease